MNPTEKCPFCGGTQIVHGKMVAEDYGGYFEPDQIHVSGWRKVTGIGTSVPTKPEAKACLECGKFWGDLDPAELRRLLAKYGAETSQAPSGAAPAV